MATTTTSLDARLVDGIWVHWSDKIIHVPRSSLTLLQAYPELRELDLNSFRLTLRNREDDAEGIGFVKTHTHNTEVTLAGLTYARTIEIVNGYTVEFEDGQYTVNCTGANHNVGDVKVPNQVSLIVNNAAGLINNDAIEFSSFENGVTVDNTSADSGTVYPVGTPRRPVNNLTDALQIGENRGLNRFYIKESMTIDTGLDFEELEFWGESVTKTDMTLDADAGLLKCEFYETSVEGTLDGENKLKNCLLKTLNFVNGVIEQCLLDDYTITLGGNTDAYFLDCWSAVAGTGTPTIDMGGSGNNLGLRNYNGGLKIVNMTATPANISLDLNSAKVTLGSNITAGTVVCRGIGSLLDEDGTEVVTGTWNGGVEIVNQSLDGPSISRRVWGDSAATALIANVDRALGLTQENYYLDQTSYDTYSGQKLMTAGRIRLYSDSVSVGSDSNVTASYNVTASWTDDELQAYKVVKV